MRKIIIQKTYGGKKNNFIERHLDKVQIFLNDNLLTTVNCNCCETYQEATTINETAVEITKILATALDCAVEEEICETSK